MHRLLFLLLAAAALPAAAQSLKPGLWEVTNKMDNPQLDQAMAQMQKQMATMPPDQRKQMEAMMAKQGVRLAAPTAGGGVAAQVCMSKEMAQRNELPMQEGCKLTRQERSGNTTRLAFTCANPPSSGEGEVTMASPESYSSRMTIKSVVHGKPETMTMQGSGKWLKADCGNLKPLGTGGK